MRVFQRIAAALERQVKQIDEEYEHRNERYMQELARVTRNRAEEMALAQATNDALMARLDQAMASMEQYRKTLENIAGRLVELERAAQREQTLQ